MPLCLATALVLATELGVVTATGAPAAAVPGAGDPSSAEAHPFVSRNARPADRVAVEDPVLPPPPTAIAAVHAAEMTVDLASSTDESTRARGSSAVEVRWVAPTSEELGRQAPEPPTSASLPGAATTSLNEPEAEAGPGAQPAPAGEVVVSIVDESVAADAGLQKVAFSLTTDEEFARSDGLLEVAVDYSSFRDAYGADWAGRLQLVVFSDCWLSTPGAAGCPGPQPLEGYVNDVAAERVSAVVDLEAVTTELSIRAGGVPGEPRLMQEAGGPGFGLSAGAYSFNGNYAVSSLNAAGEWSVGPSSGAFTYSYPIDGLPVPAGEVPSVKAVYNSNLIDGLTADQNTQGGLLGPGWSIGEGFIERTYQWCARQGAPDGQADACYWNPNGTISFDGMSDKLVPVGRFVADGWDRIQYRLRNDNGWRVEYWARATVSSSGGFGDDAQDSYWLATDPAGVQYWFGFNASEGIPGDLPGSDLGSVWTLPVRSFRTGEPCTTLSGGYCHMPWRWMLDRIVDPNGRVTTFHYSTDRNHYARAGVASDPVPYVSGAYLERIEYGQLVTTAGDTNVEAARILFGYSYRCSDTTTCPTAPTPSTGSTFPDIPVDQFCGLNATATTCTQGTPTFFSLRKLSSVTPQRRTGPGSGDWIGPITHSFGYVWKDGDGAGTDPAKLFLQEIRRTENTTGTSFPPVRFDSHASLLPNSVDFDTANGETPMPMYRVDAVLDPMGRDVRVTYSPGDSGCAGGQADWEHNIKRCFPRYWDPLNPAMQARFAIWHRYRVDRVGVLDGLGISPPMVTTYDYLEPSDDPARGGIAWHFDDVFHFVDDLSRLSWSQSRGYAEVTVTSGAASDPNRSVTTYRSFRGMDGDRLDRTVPTATNSRHVTVVTSNNAALEPDELVDHDWLAGRPLETFTTNAAGTIEYTGEITTYLTLPNGGLGGSNRSVPQRRLTRVEGGFHGLTTNTYDTTRQQLLSTVEWGDVDSAYANVNGPGNSLHPGGLPDDRCTVYGYTPISDRFPEGLANQQTVVTGTTCNPTTDPIVSETSTSFDGAAFDSAAPTAGNPTRVERSVGDTTSVAATAGAATGVATIADLTGYEPNGYAATPGWGRVASATDAAGVTVTTSHASFAGATSLSSPGNHNTQTTTTSGPLGPATTAYDTRGLDVATADVNGRVTRACYDVWMRVVEVWLPGEAFSACGTGAPSRTYAYVPTNQTVTTAPLNAQGWQVQSWRIQSRTLMSLAGDAFQPAAAGSNPVYIESDDYLDASGRTVETQTASPAGGRILVRTAYDSRGLAVAKSEPFAVAGAPGSGRVGPADASVPRDNVTTYDPIARPTNVQLRNSGTAVRDTPTSYQGRSTTSSPPQTVGGPATAASTTSVVDAYGRLVTVVEPLQTGAANPAVTTAYEYTSRDLLERVIDTAGVQTTMSYNRLGWRTTLNDPNQGVSTARYHRTGQIERSVDAKGQTITTEVDTLGRPTNVRNGASPTSPLLADYLYDPAGNKGAVARTRSYWDPNLTNGTAESALTMTATAAAFDARGRLTSSTVQINGSPTSSHANYDNPSSSADNVLFAPYTFVNAFTRNDLRWQQVIPAVAGGPAAETLTTRYTTLALLATVETDDSAVAAQSDGVRRWIAATGYDDISRQTSQQLRGIGAVGMDNTTSYQPSDGRVATMTATIAGGVNNGRRIRNATYTYDAPGNPVMIAHDPDVLANYGGQPSTADELSSLDRRECYYYDARQRLHGGYGAIDAASCPPTLETMVAGKTGWKQRYTYDSQTRIVDGGTTGVFGYANPTGPGAPTNPTGCAAGTQDRPHAVKQITSGSNPESWYGYDCNGSLARRIDRPNRVGQSITDYGWNVQNRLQTVAGGATKTNVYDPTGQLILARHSGGPRTVYLGALEIRVSGSGAPQVAKHPVPGVTIGFNAIRSYTTHNHQGSIVNDTRTSTTIDIDYFPYGQMVNESQYVGTPITNQTTVVAGRAFLNEIRDTAGLNYLNQRFYDSAIGNFVSVDAVAVPGRPATLNPYLYTQGNPIALSDPSGLCDGLACGGFLPDAAWAVPPPSGVSKPGPGRPDRQSRSGNDNIAAANFLPMYGGCATGRRCTLDAPALRGETARYYFNEQDRLDQVCTHPRSGAATCWGPDTYVESYLYENGSLGAAMLLAALVLTGTDVVVDAVGCLQGSAASCAAAAIPAATTGATRAARTGATATEAAPRFVASSDGIIDTASPALRQQIDDVADSLITTGNPPPGVRQGGLPGKPGVYGNKSGELPSRPEGYYTESDVWPGPGPRGTERIVVGGNGEAWYTPDHYGTLRRFR
jgi:RHS repeat-associated protein